jgi:hypothetical protein
MAGFPEAACTAVLVLTCACQSPVRAQQPAVLTHPSAQSTAELNRAVSEALDGMPVRLADDALTHDSALVVEHIQPRDAAGLPVNGRELARPEHFRLFTRGAHCILVHERTGKRRILKSATCAPAAAPQ